MSQNHNSQNPKDREPATHPDNSVTCGECRRKIGELLNGNLATETIIIINPTVIRCKFCFTRNRFVPMRCRK